MFFKKIRKDLVRNRPFFVLHLLCALLFELQLASHICDLICCFHVPLLYLKYAPMSMKIKGMMADKKKQIITRKNENTEGYYCPELVFGESISG